MLRAMNKRIKTAFHFMAGDIIEMQTGCQRKILNLDSLTVCRFPALFIRSRHASTLYIVIVIFRIFPPPVCDLYNDIAPAFTTSTASQR